MINKCLKSIDAISAQRSGTPLFTNSLITPSLWSQSLLGRDRKEGFGLFGLVRLILFIIWSGQQDSNLRPHAPKARALPG